jgi:uncharacterized protein (TIGR02680 family)
VNEDRFRATRYGIVGLYQYADQVFLPEQGRLALRGRNTSGKSKALELLIPFVLEGDISPRKLDPFAREHKTMHWNLIGATDKHPDVRRDKGIGYVWVEFERPSTGEQISCGIGLEASRGNPGKVQRWYFTTPQRIGNELVLCEPAGDELRPVVQRESKHRIVAGGGRLFETQEDYKAEIRERLLPFGSSELYDQMLVLIRNLRQPKLSKDLDVESVSKLLSDTLPGVDPKLMDTLGDALERLQRLGREQSELRRARSLAAGLAEQHYARYAKAILSLRATALRSAETRHGNASAALSREKEREQTAEEEVIAAAAALGELDRQLRRLRGQLEGLVETDAWKAVGRIGERRQAVDNVEAEVADREQAVREAEDELRDRRAEQEQAEEQAAEAESAVDRSIADLAELARSAGLPMSPTPTVAELEALDARIELRREQIERHDERIRAVTGATEAQRIAAGKVAETHSTWQRALEAQTEAERVLATGEEELQDAIVVWAAALRELPVDDEQRRVLIAAALDEDTDVLGEALASAYEPRREQLLRERNAQEAERAGLAAQITVLEERIDVLRSTVEPAPELRFTDRADRTGRPGAALWQVVDFATHVPSADRAALEAALEEAGLLDAWIGLDGAVYDQDATLVPLADCEGSTLADLLVADVGASGLAAEVVEGVLRSIALEGPASVAVGSWRFGPLHGRTVKASAEFIGPQARRRRRERLLAEAVAERDELADRVASATRTMESLDRALESLAAERDGFPSRVALRIARDEVRRLSETAERANAAFDEAVEQRSDADAGLRDATETLATGARADDLPLTADGLREVESARQRCGQARVQARIDLERAGEKRGAVERATAAVARVVRMHGNATEKAAEARSALDTARGRLDAAEAAHGADAEQVLERVGMLKGQIRTTEQTIAERGRQKEAGIAERAQAAAAVATADEELAKAVAARRDAAGDVRVLGQHGLFTAALDGDVPEDEAAAGGWTLTMTIDRVRALPTLPEVDAAALERSANAVSREVSHLSQQLAGHQMEATTRIDRGITLVEVSWHGQMRALHELIAALDADISQRDELLSEERRRILGRALLTEVAEHLRTRIAEVRASIARRNAALRRCPTGGGKRLRLKWVVGDHEERDERAIDLLADHSVEALPDAERDVVFAFIERRVEDAFERLEDGGDEPELRRVGVAEAFDYRRWFAFELHIEELDGSMHKLTRKTHGVGSGGEQSVLMNMALFASAAALYDLVPTAPRIIALDEAMDGIDEGVRQRVLGALVDLDLDFIATSFDINPCVSTVPRIGFYELHRENDEWGVWAQHFVWDGQRLTEIDDEPELRAA